MRVLILPEEFYLTRYVYYAIFTIEIFLSTRKDEDNPMKTELEKWVEEHKDDTDFILSELVMEVTAQIRAEMERHGINQNELAKKINVGKSHISLILNGNRGFTLHRLVTIAHALGAKLKVNLEPNADQEEK